MIFATTAVLVLRMTLARLAATVRTVALDRLLHCCLSLLSRLSRLRLRLRPPTMTPSRVTHVAVVSAVTRLAPFFPYQA